MPSAHIKSDGDVETIISSALLLIGQIATAETSKSSTYWLTMLKDCRSVGNDLDESNVLRAEVKAFKQWAVTELASLRGAVRIFVFEAGWLIRS